MMKYDELLAAAEKKMKEKNAFDAMTYYGTETGYSRVTNYEFFKTIALKLRTIDTIEADTSTNLFDCELATPIIAGAMSRPRVGGMENCLTSWAQGMKEAGSMMGVGITNTKDFSEIMKIVVPTYRISKPFKDRTKMASEIREAEQLGAVAVGTDIDFIKGGKAGERNFADAEMAPLSSEELSDLRQETELPFIVKGVLHEDDADKAMKIGASAIVVSNHRAMVLDYCAHALEILPLIRKTVGKQMTVLVDGGFMRGSDVLKALAMGADGVLVGQAIMLAFFAAGADGVRDMVIEMTAQLQRAMTLTGCRDVKSVDDSILIRRNFIM
jgi:isopentenyl diphosphate isomerase/L-lactate dehydrogenase-like FMN-dependent dehydrogenase